MRSRFSWLALCVATFLLVVGTAFAQNTISGEITGTVTDPSGAVVPNATVTLTNAATAVNQTTTTSSAGTYRFPLLRPDSYKVTANATGFVSVSRTVVAALGQVTNATLQLAVQGSQEVVEVTSEAPLLHTENGNLATTYDTKQIELLTSPGQDITNYALTSPGVTLSTGSGYGNFTANGMPGTANLYTINGNDYNDPFNNLNNSGASNLLLGQNELQEVSIVTNGYTAEYGRMAGANVNYTTKSGSNQYHGNAAWYWNGRALNANDWFGNQTGTPRPFANNNQWTGSFGGPIKKDKLFFFYDNEGLRYVLPGGGAPVYVPTAAFETATIANLTAVSPGSVAFYNKMFGLYNGAPGINRATPVTVGVDPALGCGDLAGTAAAGGGTFGTTIPCAQTFRSTVNNLNTESLQTLRIDFVASAKDNLNFRYKRDRGVQATGTDPINSLFNANSVQPEDDGQVTWNHVLNGNMVNQFIASGLYYSAIFGPPNIGASLALFPTTFAFNDGLFNNLGGADFAYPQGRNVTQYQIVDHFSWNKGNHDIKFGTDFRRNDFTSFAGSPLTSGLVTENSMTEYYNDMLSAGSLTQRFTNTLEAPVAYYSLGLYLQDAWKVNSKLNLTLSLRADRNSNETCRTNCFARPAGSFAALDHTITNPYNAAILTGQAQAFPSIEPIAWQPRIGFAWTPRSSNTLVVRGGFGLFANLYPGLLSDRFIRNLPNVTQFTIGSGTGSGSATPGVAGSLWSQAAANNAALQASFANGGTLASIQATLPTFTPPSLNTITDVTNNKYLEWNLEIEKSLGSKMALSVNYVGNHGYDLFVSNLAINTYCPASKCPSGFDGLPTAAPDGRFGNVSELTHNGISNYDGLTATLNRKFTHGFSGSVNYTWSHTLDDVSNGGLEAYSFNNASDSLLTQIDPNNLGRLNYGNSDYDFRHNLSSSYYWELPFKAENGFLDRVIGGWSLSGAFFLRSAEPFSVFNSKIASSTLKNAAGDRVLAVFNGGPEASCSSPGFDPNNPLQCLTTSQFASTPSFATAQNTWGNVSRNAFRGPSYFNSDFSVQKNFKTTERGPVFTLGANMFNVFNHPNFANPNGSLSSGTFGLITSQVSPASSPYGNFQTTVPGRIVQFDIKLKF